MAVRQEAIRIDPIDFDSNVAVGIKLPLTSASNTFFALNYTTFDQLKTNFKNLMLTEKGERYMLPDYGAGLRKFLFTQSDESLYSSIEEHIKGTTAKWMPQIEIISVDIAQDNRNENMISIAIKFQSKRDPSKIDILKIDFMTSK